MDIFTQSLNTLIEETLLFIPRLFAGLFILVATFYLSSMLARLVSRTGQARKVDPEATLLLSRLARWSLIILGVIWALDQVQFNVAAFLTGLGIVGFTIGFALQDISKNFVAGILLLVQQPFDIGDVISVSGYSGTVTDISVRATEICTLDGLHVLLPNADVYINPLTNFTRSIYRRIKLVAGVAYGTDLERASQVALQAIRGVPGVLTDDRAPNVVFDNLGESTIDFSLYYWIDTRQTTPFLAQDQGLKALNRAFVQAQIDMPFPVRTVVVRREG